MPQTPSPRVRWLKRIVWFLLVVSAAAGAFFGVRIYRARRDAGPHFDTVKVDQGRITARVTATGTVSALVTVQVGSQVSGRISSLGADFNSQVKKGDVIAKIDPELFKAALAQARANFVAAKGNLAKAKAQAQDAVRQADRSKQLADRNLIAPADRDTAVSNADAANAQVEASVGAVEQAKASLVQAQVNLDYTTIVSPIDGVVISRSVDVGQTVAASLQAPTLFTIAEDLKKMQVDTNVAEADVGKLTPGMAATFSVDAYPSERFKGQVRQIRNAPQTVQNVVTYDAVIDVDNSALKLKPGMTANVTFVYADRNDAVRVANSALRFRPPPEVLEKLQPAGSAKGNGVIAPAAASQPEAASPQRGQRRGFGNMHERAQLDRRSVWLLVGNTASERSIRVGVTDGTFSELLEGDVKPGDLTITGLSGEASETTSTVSLPGAQRPGGALRRPF